MRTRGGVEWVYDIAQQATPYQMTELKENILYATREEAQSALDRGEGGVKT